MAWHALMSLNVGKDTWGRTNRPADLLRYQIDVVNSSGITALPTMCAVSWPRITKFSNGFQWFPMIFIGSSKILFNELEWCSSVFQLFSLICKFFSFAVQCLLVWNDFQCFSSISNDVHMFSIVFQFHSKFDDFHCDSYDFQWFSLVVQWFCLFLQWFSMVFIDF